MPVTKSKQGKPLGGIGAERQSSRRHSLILDDRLLSKQYITGRIEDKISNDAFDASWDDDTTIAPSKKAVYDYVSSLGDSGEWAHESIATNSKVRSAHSGNYGIGTTLNYTNDITEKLVVDGNIKAIGDLIAGDDLLLNSDATIFSMGADAEVTLTHVHNDGLLLNDDMQLQFGDSGTYIHQSADGQLDLVADTEIQIAATTIDMNGAADISGNLGIGGNLTVTGNLTVSGTATSLDTAQVSAVDPFILINSAGTAQHAGIEVERTGLNNVSIRWNETSDVWQFTNDGSTYTNLGTGSGSGTITALNNQLANRMVTIGSTTTDLDGEAKLLYDGTDLTHTSAGAFTLTGTAGNNSDAGVGTTALSITGGDSVSTNAAVSITGHLEATTKSFNIPHPLYVNKRLVYGSLEGPEHGMYQRGSFDIEDERRLVAVDLPVYWYKMVYDDYTINLTTYGDYNVWISNRDENGFWVETNAETEWSFDWSVIGGRKDAKLVVEPDA